MAEQNVTWALVQTVTGLGDGVWAATLVCVCRSPIKKHDEASEQYLRD
jgi:hypothetical protein